MKGVVMNSLVVNYSVSNYQQLAFKGYVKEHRSFYVTY